MGQWLNRKMINLFEKIFKYGYHDTSISNIKLEKNKIILEFKNGIYTLDDRGKEVELTKSLSMIISLDLKFESIYNQIDIWNTSLGSVNLVSFIREFKTRTFEIDNVFYSMSDSVFMIDGLFDDEYSMINGVMQHTMIYINLCDSVEFEFENNK